MLSRPFLCKSDFIISFQDSEISRVIEWVTTGMQYRVNSELEPGSSDSLVSVLASALYGLPIQTTSFLLLWQKCVNQVEA